MKAQPEASTRPDSCARGSGASTHDSAGAVQGDEILGGHLGCPSCQARFPIVDGVPRFAPAALADDAQRTVERFGEQWTEFDFLSDEYEQQ